PCVEPSGAVISTTYAPTFSMRNAARNVSAIVLANPEYCVRTCFFIPDHDRTAISGRSPNRRRGIEPEAVHARADVDDDARRRGEADAIHRCVHIGHTTSGARFILRAGRACHAARRAEQARVARPVTRERL